MARSSLFASLERLVDVSRAGASEGIDAFEAAGTQEQFLRSDEGMSRRTFLAGSIGTAAAISTVGQTVLARRANAIGRPKTQPTIAVIGAGISGMTAAMALRDAGFERVTVYEANTRIGGRTFTRSNDGFFEQGQWSEWGGELIDSSHKTVIALCRRYGFALQDLGGHAVTTNGATDTLYFGGGYYPWDDAVRDWKAAGLEQIVQRQMNVLPPYPWPFNANWSPAALQLSRMSIAEWVDTFVPGGRASRLGGFLDAAYAIEFGENIERQSALSLLGLLGFSNGGGTGAWWVYGKSDERWKVVNGNQQISVAQAAELGNSNIAFGHRLTGVSQLTNGRALLQFDVGSGSTSVQADRVVMAIPIGVMKRIKSAGGFQNSGIAARTIDSVDALGFGADNKLQLQIRDRFWTQPGVWGNGNGESYSDRGYQEAWSVTSGQPGTTGIINNFTGGDISRLLNPAVPFSDTSMAEPHASFVRDAALTFLSQIEPVYPGMTQRWTGKAQLSVWHVNPFAWGAYSYYPPGYCERFCTAERMRSGPFHFAGEHVGQETQGYVEGGAAEGLRAAGEIVADFA